MKNLVKFLLVAALSMVSTAAVAQLASPKVDEHGKGCGCGGCGKGRK